MKKFIFAILVGVISGLIVWYLTGPSVKKYVSPKPTPEMQIINLHHSRIPYLKPRENYPVKITVYNNGNETAKQVKACVYIYEWVDQNIFKSSDLRKLEETGKTRILFDFMVCSEEFALLPGQSRELILNCNIGKEGNSYGAVTAFSYNHVQIWHDDLIILGVWK